MAIAAASPSVYWFITRGSGLVALILLTLSVALGVANVKRLQTARVPRFVINAVHRNASLLSRLSQGDLDRRRGTRDRGSVGGRAGDQQRAPVASGANLAGESSLPHRQSLARHAATVPVGERV